MSHSPFAHITERDNMDHVTKVKVRDILTLTGRTLVTGLTRMNCGTLENTVEDFVSRLQEQEGFVLVLCYILAGLFVALMPASNKTPQKVIEQKSSRIKAENGTEWTFNKDQQRFNTNTLERNDDIIISGTFNHVPSVTAATSAGSVRVRLKQLSQTLLSLLDVS